MRTKVVNPRAKEKLLEAAQDLILIKGFVATSLDEICKKAHLTKGSFFHYFKNKDDLAKTLLNRFCCSAQANIKQVCQCQGGEQDPLKKVYAHIDFATKMYQQPSMAKGCLLGSLAHELSDTHPEIRAICEEGFEQWAKLFREDLKQAKKKYVPKSSFDPRSLAEHFIAVIEGSQILAKAKRNRKIIENNIGHFRSYVESLFKR